MNIKYTQFNSTPFETHMLVYEKIKEGSKVLDVGCATGYFAKKLKEKGCKVWGIEQNSDAAEEAKKYCKEVIVGDIEGLTEVSLLSLPFKKDFFDYILLLDVIEHLREPLKLLGLIKPYLKQDSLPIPPPRGSTSAHPRGVLGRSGKIIISVPNVAFISIRLALLRGKFNYQNLGIMDRTHLKFFTKETFLELIKDSGLEVEEFEAASGFSQISLIGKYLNFIPKYWQNKITKLRGTLLGYQFIAVCSDTSTRGVFTSEVL